MDVVQGVDTVLLHKQYSEESLIDLEGHIWEMVDSSHSMLPKDEYGFIRGTFNVIVVWTPEER